MKHLRSYVIPILLLAGACNSAITEEDPSVSTTQAASIVNNLYKEVIARRPLGVPNRKIFGPYLSKNLLGQFDLDDACFDNWRRHHSDPNLKPEVGLIEEGFFSGSREESQPHDFLIEKTESEKDGTYRVHVKLKWSDSSNNLVWNVAVVVVREGRHLVVDDIIHFNDDQSIDYRLSDILKQDLRGCR